MCLTLPEFDHAARSEFDRVIPAFNSCITAIARYFGATVANTDQAIFKASGWAFYHDESSVHPNISGHERIFQEIAKAMWAKIKE